jgi:DNA-binding transcriptional MerR regulator
MFGIGDFARHGRVSVRMLRHYDAIGLLRPAHADPVTGYRSYEAGQLARLNRIVALKDLGFTLAQVRSILDDTIGAEELRGMLRLRRAELAERVAADTARLAEVEARLRIIEQEGAMPADDVQIKRLEAVRVARLGGIAAGYGPAAIGPVIGPLFDELVERIERAGLPMTGPGIAWYADDPGGDGILVNAGIPVGGAEGVDHPGLEIVELPEVARAATLIHRGDMDEVMASVQALARWIDAGGYRSAGPHRELYLDVAGDRDTWVTELQEPLAED